MGGDSGVGGDSGEGGDWGVDVEVGEGGEASRNGSQTSHRAGADTSCALALGAAGVMLGVPAGVLVPGVPPRGHCTISHHNMDLSIYWV